MMLTRKGPTYFITSKNIVTFGQQIVHLASLSNTEWTKLVHRSTVIHTIFRNFFGTLRKRTFFCTTVQPVSPQLSPLHDHIQLFQNISFRRRRILLFGASVWKVGSRVRSVKFGPVNSLLSLNASSVTILWGRSSAPVKTTRSRVQLKCDGTR